MTRRAYSIECQRIIKGEGYVPCDPHRAKRVVVIETTFVPAKAGRKPYQTKRMIAAYSGSAMLAQAKATKDSLVRRAQPKPADRKIIGRSCTIAEYDQIMRQRRETGSY